MRKWDSVRKTGYRAAAAALAACAAWLAVRNGVSDGAGELLLKQLESEMVSFWNPAFPFADHFMESGGWAEAFPVLRFLCRERGIRLQDESYDTCEEIIRAEGRDEDTDSLSAEEMLTPEQSGGRRQGADGLEELVRMENGTGESAGWEMAENDGESAGWGQTECGNGEYESGETAENAAGTDGPDGAENGGGQTDGVQNPAGGLGGDAGVSEGLEREIYQWEYYEKYDELVKEFYAVDASTAIDESQLNLKELLGRDLSIEKRGDGTPQILIYHTHSQEAFLDSVPGDENTAIMGVGEVLAQILREQYGYSVLHHLGKYDVEDRDYAYNNSLPELEALLAENPGIEVVIDLHRDEIASDQHLVTQIDGRPTAMFMFFNGLSRTRKHGDIDYLPNDNLADNLAFSFQMQVLCNAYYPGLTRRIYLKGYRYNMHLKPRYLLIEMGAQNNTYEECCNACIPLARMLDLELSGADFGYDG